MPRKAKSIPFGVPGTNLPMPDMNIKTALFVGVESFNWSLTEFDNCIAFCKKYGIQQIILKVYEITQGEWYSQLGGAGFVVNHIKASGLDVLPYGFFYGNDVQTESTVVLKWLGLVGKFCMDMEGAFDNNSERAAVFATELANHPGVLYVSTWANPVNHSWTKNIEILDSIVSVWMPQAYNDSLIKDMYAQFPKVQGLIWPTFHIINTPYQDASIYQNISLWEYQLGQQDTASLTYYIAQNEGKSVSIYPTNSKGMIANYLPVSEFQPGHSEFECGAFAVSLNMRATNYSATNNDSIPNLIAWAESEYAKYAGSNASSNSIGASISDMHNMIKDTQTDRSGGLHWWDTDISPTSIQEHDIATIKAALMHGYPVVATVYEASIFDLDLNYNPYWWGASGKHIITYVGIASDGNLLAIDPANVLRGDGNLQTPKYVQPWPRRYDIRRVDNQWATIIQTPWLPPILSGDPISWPPYSVPTPAPTPQPDQVVQLVYDPNSKQIIFMNGVSAVYRIQL